MNRFSTQGIILSRTNFGEADRILTFLTFDRGKVRAMAKGVRKSGSKLAGSIEPFSVSDITLITGRGQINTLVSARLVKHYGDLAKDLQRSKAASDFIRRLNKNTEENTEQDYFDLLSEALKALDDTNVAVELVRLWFDLQLLRLSGHTPNLKTDTNGRRLESGQSYNFDIEKMAFTNGRRFTTDHIKFLRLALNAKSPGLLNRVRQAEELAQLCHSSVDSMLDFHVRS